MSGLTRALVVVIGCATPAAAERVLLADGDPALQHAVQAALAPWRVEVVVAADAHPRDPAHAAQLGDASEARFVVWRDGTDLVVLDRERGGAEHRDAPAGPLDAASAAAAALTVKTLMRLSPPVETAPPRAGASAAPTRSFVLRAQGGVAGRWIDDELGGRAHFAVLVKPSALPLWFGIAGELGTARDVAEAGFKGTWRDASVLGIASASFAIAERFSFEPLVGAGVTRSSLEGDEGPAIRRERAVLAMLRGGVIVRRALGAFSLGGSLALDLTLGTPTYTRETPGMPDVFAVPTLAVSAGLVLAADLGGE